MSKATKYLLWAFIPFALAAAVSLFASLINVICTSIACAIVMILLLELARGFPSGSLAKSIIFPLQLGILIFNILLWPLYIFWCWYLETPFIK